MLKTKVKEALRPTNLKKKYKDFRLEITGNSLTIFVMLRKPFRKMSVSVVLICLALSDTVVGLMLPFNKMFIRNMMGYDVRAMSLAGCRAFYWAFRLFKVKMHCVVHSA